MVNIKTPQHSFWTGAFAKGYIKRNYFNPKELDALFTKDHEVSRTKMNEEFLKGIPKDARILEVGTNVGNQLLSLEKMGFTNLYGIEFNPAVVDMVKERVPKAQIIWGSALDIPFKDNYFDLVFTADVLIHISPKDVKTAMKEMARVSKKYIYGYEYFAEKYTTINYRGNTNVLWKAPFSKIFKETCPELKMVKEKMYPFVHTPHNANIVYLFKKGTAKK